MSKIYQKILFQKIFYFFQHWKQTVFYLCDSITCKKGEQMEGVFGVMPNSRNPRDLDFRITINFAGELCELQENNKYVMH